MSAALLILGPVLALIALRFALPEIVAAAREEIRDAGILPTVLALLSLAITGPLVAACLFLIVEVL